MKLTHNYQLNKLKNDTSDVIKDKSLSQGFANPVIQGVTEHINTKQIVPQTAISDFASKIANLRAAKALGKKAIGAIPFAGAAYSALSGEPAQAAEELVGDIPVVGQAFEAMRPEPSGPAPGTFDHRIENGTLTDEDKQQLRMQALQQLGNR